MSTNNIRFYEDLTKIIFQLSSNKHLISSSAIHEIAVQSSALRKHAYAIYCDFFSCKKRKF